MNAKLQRAVCLPIIKSTLGVETKFIDTDIVLRKTYHTRYHSAIPFSGFSNHTFETQARGTGFYNQKSK